MMNTTQELDIQNRQRTRRISIPALRDPLLALLTRDLNLESFEIGIHLVGPALMARVNQQYLNHEGSTDVITFDHAEPSPVFPARRIHGEMFICVQDAIHQAGEFKTHWTSEVFRYAVHGILHLQGYDDLEPAARKVMKARENRWVKRLSSEFPIRRIAAGK